MINNDFLIGSPEYMDKLQQSSLSARDQLAVILNDQLESYIDSYGFLQLPPTKYHFLSTLTPMSDFYVYFRDLVVGAYRTSTGLKADQLGQKIHLFRSYLDRQNITFIRQYPVSQSAPHVTDFQRLVQYAQDNRIKLDLKTSAGFHNRYHQGFTYPANMKVQLIRNSYALTRNRARMIEFIVDISSGNFVSQWNVYHVAENGLVDANSHHYSPEQLYQIANTESFNYGIPSGGRPVLGKYRHTHQWLDIDQPQNSKIRRAAKDYWRYPRDYNRGGHYADLIKTIDDIETWRNIPQSYRQQVYDDFISSLRHRHNRGITHFLNHSKYQQFFDNGK